jgi:vWA domain found in the FtsH ternary systems/N-terminal helical region fused to the FtsH ternary system vWA domain
LNLFELRDPVEARQFVAQGLWLIRATPPTEALVESALAWSLEIAAQGEPMPPVGVVADIGQLLIEPRWSVSNSPGSTLEIPGWPAGLSRSYEDAVLGKLDADPSFARASDALARYRGRDFGRGLAFVVDRIRARSRVGGVLVNPVALKAEAGRTPSQILADGWESLEQDGPMPILLDLYGDWVKAARDLADVLGLEDVFELEHGTALASFGQRIALRQVLRVAADFEASVPVEKPRPSGRRPEISTRYLDEDTYPVGGFSSISTRGSIESLLHSQLVYMETGERPDPFDVKFVRDELLYYARDENQFLRRRRSFVFALFPDLARARVKDPGLPHQRIVLLLGLLVASIRRLSEWLGDDSLTFEVVFVEESQADPLVHERELIELILYEAIARGEVATARMPLGLLAETTASRSRRSLCHALAISIDASSFNDESTMVSLLVADGPIPMLGLGGDPPERLDDAEPLEAWRGVFRGLLEFWI